MSKTCSNCLYYSGQGFCHIDSEPGWDSKCKLHTADVNRRSLPVISTPSMDEDYSDLLMGYRTE